MMSPARQNPITVQATQMAMAHLRLVQTDRPAVRDEWFDDVAADVRAAMPPAVSSIEQHLVRELPRQFKFWRWTISIERKIA